ncbi:hypothetical protein B0H10DRAFT_1948699 [Mycena sp. CBHHK59/15]|nr:hypothetical protein B0H10DRAFT_1948699 [Mycena sp. CBHHK59/15]
MPIHEFTRLRLVAKLNKSGNIALSFKPLEGTTEPPKDLITPNLSLHFDRTCEDGVAELSVYVSGGSSTPCPTNAIDVPINSQSRASPSSESSVNAPAGRAPAEQLDPIWPANLFEPQTFQSRSKDHSIFAPLSDSEPSRPGIMSSMDQLFRDEHDIGEHDIGEYDFDALCSTYDGARTMSATGGWPDANALTQYAVDSQSASPASTFLSLPDRPGSSTDGFSFPPHEFHPPSQSSPSTSSTDDDSPAPLGSDSSYRLQDKRHKYPCLHRGCKRKFTDEYIREIHMVTHQTKAKPTFPCTFPICPEVFSRKHDRLRHEVTQHGKQCEWICHKCRKFFASEKTLTKHRCSGCPDTRWVVSSD